MDMTSCLPSKAIRRQDAAYPGRDFFEQIITINDLARLVIGISGKRARDMGHLAQTGPGGMIEVLKPLRAARKILIHINNTNPILNEDSPQRRVLDATGIEVAYDGMEIEL